MATRILVPGSLAPGSMAPGSMILANIATNNMASCVMATGNIVWHRDNGSLREAIV